jgi:hypothetical protein
MTRSHARSPKGQRAHCENYLNPRVSTIGALGTEGLLTAFCDKGTIAFPDWMQYMTGRYHPLGVVVVVVTQTGNAIYSLSDKDFGRSPSFSLVLPN